MSESCTGKALTGSGKFTAGTDDATAALSRNGRVEVRGVALISSNGLKLILDVSKKLKTGDYTLTLSRHGHEFRREALTLH
jgi:hypothetical protein